MKKLQYGSSFSGAGGFDLGFDAAGLECQFQVEIDATAMDVLNRRWPNVPKFADVREVGKRNLPRVDVLIGGFPCQDLSVAGARRGLQGGTRSGLFFEFARIAKELRPSFVVWENVPGLLSSDDGRDFARIVRHLGDCGFRWGAWRVLDSEGFGVAQHRRRVFGVFTCERARAGSCAEILALGEGLRRHPEKGGETGAEVAGTLGGGTAVRGWNDDIERAGAFIPFQCQGTNVGPNGTLKGSDATNGVPMVAFVGNRTGGARESAAALKAKGGTGRQDFESETFIVSATGQRTHALTSEGHDASEDGTGRGTPIVAFSCKDHRQDTNGSDHVAIAFQERTRKGGRSLESQENVAYALTAPTGGGRGQERNIAHGLSVRRLTPRECERLMGWPDDHTRYRADGREIADGPRYRLCGNGVVASVSEWIGRRLIAAIEKKNRKGLDTIPPVLTL